MDKYISEPSNLRENIRKLYFRAGQLNLYVCRRYNKNNLDIKRLKMEIEKIKRLLVDIENEIDNL